MAKTLIAVIGAGEGADIASMALAEALGKAIAEQGWILVTGGRNVGIMEAVHRGAKQIPDSVTVGILPSRNTPASPFVDIPIVTDMGNARNNVIVLSAKVIIACGDGGPGTVSEIALALKSEKPVILLGASQAFIHFFQSLGKERIFVASSPEHAIELVKQWIKNQK